MFNLLKRNSTRLRFVYISFFFFNVTATTEIYTLSLHDALPIFDTPLTWTNTVDGTALSNVGGFCCGLTGPEASVRVGEKAHTGTGAVVYSGLAKGGTTRSEEHTSELQSHSDLVCRLLLEKKKIQ